MKKKIIIYGAGLRGVQLYKWLLEAELERYIYAFCDKNYKDVMIPWKDIPVLPYEYLKYGNYVYLVSLSNNKSVQELLDSDNQEYYICIQEFAQKYFEKNKKLAELFSIAPFFLNENNNLLKECFHELNYKVIEYDSANEFCYIFFSSNGLYYPNDIGTFSRIIKAEDRFEWENLIGANTPCQAAKCIYVRDLRKTWYVTGINHEIDSLDKLINFLKEITKGYKVITVGSSAGGYMASLIGAKLNAHLVFNFSGQYSLYLNPTLILNYFWLNKYKDDRERNIYYDICELIKDTVPIIYFYPKYSEWDVAQAMLVKEFDNVYSIPIDAYNHGETISNMEKALILTKSFSEIKRIYPK